VILLLAPKGDAGAANQYNRISESRLHRRGAGGFLHCGRGEKMNLHARGLWLRYALPMVIAMLAVLWSEAALAVPKVACSPLVAFPSCLSEADEFDSSPLGARTPLILIHGINANDVPGPPDTHAWDSLLAYAVRETHNNIPNPILSRFKPYKFEYFSNRSDGQVRISVKKIGETLKELLGQMDSSPDTEFNGKSIAIVAHSMGGLVARSYMEEQAGGDRVLRLITLGTPHHGSPFANGNAFQVMLDPLSGTQEIYLGYNAFLYGGVGYTEGNRFDLHWDNYDAGLHKGYLGWPLGLPYNNYPKKLC
jgi:pimeloyl-ACP methyl ester carboxylesterase